MNKDSANDKKMEELVLIANQIELFYWVPIIKTPFGNLNKICERIDEECIELSEVFKAFKSNLASVESVLMLPYKLLSTDIVVAADKEGILQINKLPNLPSDSQESLIDFSKVALEQGLKSFSNKRDELNHLMCQAIILIWSAFENYSKDMFIKILNKSPNLYKYIKEDDFLKERFYISNSYWEKLLEQNDYNLSAKLGDVLARNKDFSSPALLERLFLKIFTKHEEHPDTLRYFEDRRLGLLGQRRHLIVHRLGVVDDEYMSKTNDESQLLGQRLKLRGRDIADSLAIAAQCAMVLYGVSRHLWASKESKL